MKTNIHWALPGAAMLWLVAATAPAAMLYSAGFEPGEGYPTATSAALTGTPTGTPQWQIISGTTAAVTAKYNVFSGAYAARAWGTAGNLVQFNASPTTANQLVTLDGYLLVSNSSTASGYADLALLDASGNRQVSVELLESSGKLAFRTGGTTTQSDSFAWVYNAYYHLTVVANYATHTAQVYAKQVAAGDTTPLTAADLVSFGSQQSIAFADQGQAYASHLRILATAGTEGFFDQLSVSAGAIPEPASLLLLAIGSVAVLRRRR